MNIDIITKNRQVDIYGFGTTAINKEYAGTAFNLSGKLWKVVKANSIKNKGMNVWVYETADTIFAGVELDNPADGHTYGLDEKKITLKKYAYYKYVGPYSLIKQTGQTMVSELTKQGYEVILPTIEIYGHWTSDETKLETELFMCLK